MDRIKSTPIIEEAAALASQCQKIGSQLYDIAGRSKEAVLSIRSTAADCEALQITWSRIEKWSQHWGEVDDALLRWLNPALVIGKMIVSALERDLYKLKASMESSRFKRRPENPWNDNIVRAHRNLLKGQVGDLSILLEVIELRSPTDRVRLLRSREPLLQVSDNSSWSMVPPRLPKATDDRASVSTYRSTDPLLKRTSSEKGSFITSPRSITDENFDEKVALYDGIATPRRSISALPPRGQADTWHLDLAVQQGRIDIIQNVLSLWVPELDEWKHQQLPKACRDGNEQLVKCLLKNGADARAREMPESYLTTGRTSLHLAAIQGNLEIAKALIEHGASVNEIYTGYRTPLHEAASRGYAAMTELLLQQGAPVDACDESRYRPLHAACMAGSHDAAKLLLQYGANLHSIGNDKYHPIHHAAQDGGNPELIALLAASGVDIEAETPFQNRPLQLACKVENALVVSALLNAGADPNGGEGLKPLQLAARSGNTTVVQVLIDAGAEIDFGAGEGNGIELSTPLGIALYSRNLPVITKLLEAGANVDAANAVGFAPIHMIAMGHSISPTLASVQERRDEALRILLQHGPDCKATDYRGYQVFHYLADSANFVSFDALHVRKLTTQFLNSGADINALDANGDSPLDITAMNMKSWLVHIFVESGARALRPSTLRNLAAATHSPKRETSFDATKTLQHLRNFKITQHPRSVTV